MSKTPALLDAITDRVFAYSPQPAKQKPSAKNRARVNSWNTPIDSVLGDEQVRIDALHYNPAHEDGLQKLRESGLPLKPLRDLASVGLPSQFTRIWADDPQHGHPYMSPTDLMSLFAIGKPSKELRYLSHATDTDVEQLVVQQGWLLMTCSGTIGRVYHVPERLDGWIATHDLLRIRANSPDQIGYLYAWLQTPIAQAQVFSHTHGGQIDHITDDQIKTLLVPMLPENRIRAINDQVIKALRVREKALKSIVRAWKP